VSAVLKALPQVSEERKTDLLARVDELRAALVAGEIRELAYVAVMTNGDVRHMVGPTNNAFTMIGALERLKMRVHKRHIADLDEN